MSTSEIAAIESTELADVTGGAARSAGTDDSKLTLMLTQVTDSIKEMAAPKQSSMDQMMPMMMMMMMGGGGGGAAAAPPPPPPQPNVVKVNVRR